MFRSVRFELVVNLAYGDLHSATKDPSPGALEFGMKLAHKNAVWLDVQYPPRLGCQRVDTALQVRPDHPSVSVMQQMKTVPSMNHLRPLMACTRWMMERAPNSATKRADTHRVTSVEDLLAMIL